LPWKDIVVELDHTEFVVKDRQGLNLLFTGLTLGLQSHGFHSEMFPVDLLYRHWKNADGQVMSCLKIFIGLWDIVFCVQ
jgi:CCR4-NOT transcription complex subunit 1